MSYSRFLGEPAVAETTYEYDEQGRLARSWTVAEPEWTESDRGLVLALLAEQQETCAQCGHLMSECRDPKTAGTWMVQEDICQPSRVAQAVAEDVHKAKRRGVVLLTRRT